VSRTSAFLAVVLAAAGVLVLVALLTRTERPSRASAPAAGSRVHDTDAVERKLQQLEREVRALKSETAALQTASRAAPSVPAPMAHAPEPVPVPVDPVSAEEQQARDEARFQALDFAFRAENRDGSWANATEGVLLTVATQPALAEISVTSAACAATLCRFEAAAKAADGEVPVDALIDAIPRDQIGAGTVRRLGEPMGNRVVAYFARKGHELPPP